MKSMQIENTGKRNGVKEEIDGITDMKITTTIMN